MPYIELPRRSKDITDKRFGRLVALGPIGKVNKTKIVWLCQCDCGNKVAVPLNALSSGATQSCGCLQKERASKARKSHGMSRTPLHRIWLGMIKRCFNENATYFQNYGGRGITVAIEWRHDFQAFHDHVSQLPHCGQEGYSLDRIDNDGNYEPDNVRWATRQTQNQNMRRNRHITHDGRTLSVNEWATELGISPSTLWYRIYSRWSDDRIISTPIQAKK